LLRPYSQFLFVLGIFLMNRKKPVELDLGVLCPFLHAAFVAEANAVLMAIQSTDERNRRFTDLVWHASRIDMKNLSGREFARLTSDELLRRLGENIIAEQKIEDYNALLRKEFTVNAPSTMTCRRCGAGVQWNVGQTRGADEGSTVFVSCKPCGVRWRM
jgi:DNA-directed RNA polymerase subunit M/transcription elongation factor TFIIS